MEISNQDIKMLRDIYNKSGELLKRLGKLDGDASESKAIKKEPSKKEKVDNYLEVIGQKNTKPKHLAR